MTSEHAMGVARSKSTTMRRILGRSALALLAILLIGAAALWYSFSPAELAMPVVATGPLPKASPPPTMSVSRLSTGYYESPAALTYRGGSWGDERHLAAAAVLVRHPRGNLLIDAGFGSHIDRDLKLIPRLQRTPHVLQSPVLAQLAKAGMTPRDIAAIIPTHTHWDHVSGIDDLRGVPVLETRNGLRYVRSGKTGTEVISSFRSVRYALYDFDGGPYLGFPRSHDVWGDGSVVIVSSPAHTPDSVIVFVSLPSGQRYAFVGDLVFQREGLTIPAEKPWIMRYLIGEDDREVHRDIALLREAGHRYPRIKLIPAHDKSSFDELPAFPDAAR